MSSDSLRQAAAAGMLAGIVAGWRKDANPGALDDLVVTPLEPGPASASCVLLFGGLPGHEVSAGAFRLTCEQLDAPSGSESPDARS